MSGTGCPPPTPKLLTVRRQPQRDEARSSGTPQGCSESDSGEREGKLQKEWKEFTREGSKGSSWQREMWHQGSETGKGLESWRSGEKVSDTETGSEV